MKHICGHVTWMSLGKAMLEENLLGQGYNCLIWQYFFRGDLYVAPGDIKVAVENDILAAVKQPRPGLDRAK